MKHKSHPKYSKSYKRRFKRMAAAAAVAGAAFVSSVLLPGAAQAAAIPDAGATPGTAAVHTVKSPKGIFTQRSDSKNTMKKIARAQAKATAKQQSEKVAAHAQLGISANQQTGKVVQASSSPAKAPAESQVLHVRATAYAPGPHDNGKWGDKTHIGTTVRPGIIAVDPKVIPLGSKVYIEYPDGTGQHAVAEDTGGAIKGNRIDVAMKSVKQAYDFGIKNVKVHVLGKKA